MGFYVTDWSAFRFLPRAKEAIAAFTKAGFETVVISNQGGVARGLMTQADLDDLTEKMRAEIEKIGGKLNDVFYCVHQTSDACECKKPNIGLIKKAMASRGGTIGESYFIGDSEEDMGAGKTAGLKTVLVLSGRTNETTLTAIKTQPDVVKKDLWEAAQWILAQRR